MVELSVMAMLASMAAPAVLPPSKELQGILPLQGKRQDAARGASMQLSALQRLDDPVQMLPYQPHFPVADKSVLLDAQYSRPESIQLSFGIAEQHTRQEKILKFLTSGSDVKEIDISLLSELMGYQTLAVNMGSQPYIPDDKLSLCEFVLDEPQQYLLEKQIFIPDPHLDFVQSLSHTSALTIDRNGGVLFAGNGDEMRDLLLIVAEFNMSKREASGCKTAFLVPYFDRKRRPRTNNQVSDSKLANVAVDPSKSSANVKPKSSKKKQMGKNLRERDLYQKNYFHASEAFLSVLLDKDKGSSTILSLKKAGPEIAELLTQFSIGIAGTGLAVLLSVACKMATGGRSPLPTSRLLNTGVGFGLFWLSWAVNRLRDTITSIFKCPDDMKFEEDEVAMKIERSMNGILFRAATLVALAALKFV